MADSSKKRFIKDSKFVNFNTCNGSLPFGGCTTKNKTNNLMNHLSTCMCMTPSQRYLKQSITKHDRVEAEL